MSRLACIGAMLASLAVSACDRGPVVQILGDSTRLPKNLPSPRKSAIFDGKSLHLRGARGETLGFQVRIGDRRARNASVALPPVAAVVRAFGVRSLDVRSPSTSMYGRSFGRGVYPDILIPARSKVETDDLAFFDVAIPQTAHPGRYAGELTLGERRIPIALDVSPARIHTEKDPLVWAFYLPSDIARVHGLNDDDSPELIQKERAYYDLFREHGVLLASDLGPNRFAARRAFVRDTRYWPVGIDTSSPSAIATDVAKWLDLFRGLGVTPFAIPIDEPRTHDEKLRARQIAEAIGKAGGGRPLLLRAVTDMASPDYGDAIDVFVSPRNLPAIASGRRALGERFWTYNGRPPQAGSMILDTEGVALRTWGWIAYRYGVELWYAWQALYFSDRYNGGGATDVLTQPITFDERKKGGTDFGNGDGVLAYPGPLPSLRLKTLRRGLEDRLLLLELEKCGQGVEAQRIAQRMVGRALGEAGKLPSWPAQEIAWEQARNEILDAIEQRCHAPE